MRKFNFLSLLLVACRILYVARIVIKIGFNNKESIFLSENQGLHFKVWLDSGCRQRDQCAVLFFFFLPLSISGLCLLNVCFTLR